MNKSRGITLVSLVVTIIVLIILAGVSINIILGDNGILTKAKEAKFKTELAKLDEEFKLYATNKSLENSNFELGTLNAGKNILTYNTKPEDEIGNIKTILSESEDKYVDCFEIIKGELIYTSQNERELRWALEIGMKINPYLIVDGVLLSANTNLMLMDENTGTIVIPETVREIGRGAFANLDGIKTLIIPGTVKKIGMEAFTHNNTLENVIIEEGVKVIGWGAFRYCKKLENIKLPQSIITIEMAAFDGCSNLAQINIPEKVTRIESWTFANCALKEIILPNNLEYIGENAFRGTRITDIKIPSNVQSIGSQTFYGCTNLINIDITENSNYEYINGILMTSKKDQILFLSDSYMKSISTFSIPEGITEFNIPIRYENIKKVIIPTTLVSGFNDGNTAPFPYSITEIEVTSGNENFEIVEQYLLKKSSKVIVCCYSKESIITIPEGIKGIDPRAFCATPNVHTINTSKSLETIQYQAFSNAAKLENINIKENVNFIDGAFCPRRDINITISENNPYYMVEDGIIYNKNKTILVSVVKSIKGTLEILEGIEIIENKSMMNQTMSVVIIPEGCKEIKSSSFKYCNSLTKVVIPSSIEKIEDCFSDCGNLNEIIINKPKNSISGSPWAAPKGNKIIYWN